MGNAFPPPVPSTPRLPDPPPLHLGRYAKAITAAVTGTVGWFAQVIATNAQHFHVSNPQWLALAVIELTALGVYGMPNAS
jgi:hypothetical protein